MSIPVVEVPLQLIQDRHFLTPLRNLGAVSAVCALLCIWLLSA
jgi:hypothetical protein